MSIGKANFMLNIHSLYFKYPNQRAYVLQRIRFAIAKQELFAFVGASGSGKTTLLKLLSGQLQLTKGRIDFQQQPLKGPNEMLIPGHPEIALVAQDYALLPNHTVYENIEYHLREHTKSYINKRIKELLQYFDLQNYRSKKPYELSGGQQQKLALAKAISNEPKLLLLDEPFSHLDNIQKTAFKEELRRMKKNLDMAIILVTHTMEDALSLADQVFVLNKGKIIQQDDPEQLYQFPENAYVAALTGNYNLIPSQFFNKIMEVPPNTTQVGIRTSDIVIERKGPFKGTVRAVYFEGIYRIVDITVAPNLNLQSIVLKKQFKVGEKIRFSILKDAARFF